MALPVLTLGSRALIRVSGPDWRSFLQGLITQDTDRLSPHDCLYGALLTPQGRLLHDFFLWDTDGDCLIDVAATGVQDLARRLSMYRLRAKVEITPVEGGVAAALGRPEGQAPPGSERWRIDPRLPELGWRAIVMGQSGALADEDAYRLRCLERGVAALEIDARESDYPLELNLDVLGGVDFKKGCFVGQETTSRMHRRGVVKNRLLPVTFEGPAPPFGAEVLSNGLRAGEMRGGVPGRGLALLRLDRIGGPLETAPGANAAQAQPLKLDPQPWAERLSARAGV